MRELPLSVWKARRTVGQQAEVAGRLLQLPARGLRVAEHLARFLEEDLAHLVVVLEVADRRDRRLGRRAAPARGSGSSAAGSEAVATKSTSACDSSPRARRDVVRHRSARSSAACAFSTVAAQRRLVGRLRLVRQPLEIARHLVQRHVVAHRA